MNDVIMQGKLVPVTVRSIV